MVFLPSNTFFPFPPIILLRFLMPGMYPTCTFPGPTPTRPDQTLPAAVTDPKAGAGYLPAWLTSLLPRCSVLCCFSSLLLCCLALLLSDSRLGHLQPSDVA